MTINVTATSDDFGAYRVDVQYDSSLVTATWCTSTHGVCSIDIIATDTVRMNGSTIAGITGTDVVLSTITFLAGPTDGTAALTVNPATPIVADTVGDSLVVTPTSGAITIDQETTLGDVACSDLVNVVDALFILQYEVGLRVDSGGCPFPPEPPPPPASGWINVASCDVSGDGICNVVDALFILQCEVGIPNAFCPEGFELGVSSMEPHGQ